MIQNTMYWNKPSRLVLLSLLLSAAVLPAPASAQPLCQSCEVHMGIGSTYHFWGATEGTVLPLTVNWHDNRYEVGVFRMATPQTLSKDGTSLRLADPYWGVSASRRFTLLERGPVRAFFGFGLSYRTESDLLTATRWDFASQLGVHVRLPRKGTALEFSLRHWSNAGIEKPNKGQDFATLTFVLNPQFFRTVGFNLRRDTRVSDVDSRSPDDPAQR